MDTGTHSTPTRSPSTLSVARTVAIFAIAYAVVDLVLGVVPVNLMLRHFMSAVMPRVWLVSVVRLALRTLECAVGCAATLHLTRRAGGPLTSTARRGIMSIGAITSGAIAGALEVGVHRLLVWPLIHLAQRSTAASELASALLTLAAVAIVAVILLVPRTRVVREPSPDTDALHPAEQPA